MFPRKLTSAAEVSLKTLGKSGYEFEISDSGYGKDHVKILHVRREGPIHYIKEFEVNTHLKLYSKKDYLNGELSSADGAKRPIHSARIQILTLIMLEFLHALSWITKKKRGEYCQAKAKAEAKKKGKQ